VTTHYKTQAFVFKKNDTNESDRNFSVFTDNFGRLEVFAKAIRKDVSKLRSGIDLFFLSDIEFIQGKNRKTLTDAVKIEKFENIITSPEKFFIAQRIAEIVENFIKGQEKDHAIFNLIQEVFTKLNNYQNPRGAPATNYPLLHYYFLWNTIAILGYCPEIEKCNVCHSKINPYNNYFSCKLGGVICKKCFNEDKLAFKINSDVIKMLRLILKQDWQILSKLKIGPASQKLFQEISQNYYNYLLSK